MTGASSDVELLREMLREVERLLDRQAAAMEHLDRKAERLLVVAVAAFAGTVAVVTVLEERMTEISGIGLVAAFLPGAVGIAVASAMFLDGYLGFRTHPAVRVGPSVDWIARKSRDDSWTLVDHMVSILMEAAVYERKNAQSMRRTAARCRAGVAALGGGIFLHAVAYTFMTSGVT